MPIPKVAVPIIIRRVLGFFANEDLTASLNCVVDALVYMVKTVLTTSLNCVQLMLWYTW